MNASYTLVSKDIAHQLKFLLNWQVVIEDCAANGYLPVVITSIYRGWVPCLFVVNNFFYNELQCNARCTLVRLRSVSVDSPVRRGKLKSPPLRHPSVATEGMCMFILSVATDRINNRNTVKWFRLTRSVSVPSRVKINPNQLKSI